MPPALATDLEQKAVRDHLVDTLTGVFDLERVAERACSAADVPGREPQLAYCLVALMQKPEAVERYALRLDAADFPARLATCAGVVAGHLRRWAEVYDAIQAEFDRSEITTLRSYIQAGPEDDLIDRAADHLAPIVGGAPQSDEMTLDLARAESPASNAYVFQSPLDAWIRLSAGRRLAARTVTVPIETARLPSVDGDLADHVQTVAAEREDQLWLVAAAVARLFATRELLAELIARADHFEAEIRRMQPESPSHIVLFGRLRARIADIADRLRQEQRALADMAAYVVLAMRSAATRQSVVVLSLRVATIERAAAAVIAELMQEALTDERHPTPMLLARTVAAAERGVSSRRVSALRRLRERPDRRGRELADVSERLAALPARVAGNAEIAAALPEPLQPHTVAEHRSQALKELRLVDPLFGRVFSRYAMGTA